MGPPKVRQVSPGGHGAALQSCDEVSEQRMRWLTAGCTGLSGFRMSIAVTWSRTRAIGVRSLRHRAMIALPTMLGSWPAIGVVMSTTAWTTGVVPSTNVVVTAGLGRPLGVWSRTLTRGGRVSPAGRGGSGRSKAKSLAFTFASGCESGKHSIVPCWSESA